MIGALDTRATLQQKTLTPDGGGGFAESWDDVAPVWIALAPRTGRAVFGPARLESIVRHTVRLRRRDDVAAGWRLLAGGRALYVRARLDGDPRDPLITLACEETP